MKQIMTKHKFWDEDLCDVFRLNPKFIEIFLKPDTEAIILTKQDIIALAKEFGLTVEDKS